MRLRDGPIHGALVIRDDRHGGVLQPLCSGPGWPVFPPPDHHPLFIGVRLVRVSVAGELNGPNAV